MAALGRPWPARPGRTWLIGLAVPWLVGLLLAAPAGASHPSVMPEIGPAEIDASAPDPTLADHRPPAGPWTAALVCLAVLTLPALLAARQWRHSATVATLGLLIWFSAEAAFHSAHHATEPEEADHCQVFSAAQHLPGVDPDGDEEAPVKELVSLARVSVSQLRGQDVGEFERLLFVGGVDQEVG